MSRTLEGAATYGGVYIAEQKMADPLKKSGITDSQGDAGGWPELKSLPADADTDHDGMPDVWEVENGLDPKNRDDRNNVTSNGYTMLEEYINNIK